MVEENIKIHQLLPYMDISKNRFYKKVYKLENLIGCESDGEKKYRKTFLKEVEQVKYLKKAINSEYIIV